jgi:hypothetical protein
VGEHGVDGVGEVDAGVDESAVEIEDEKAEEHRFILEEMSGCFGAWGGGLND